MLKQSQPAVRRRRTGALAVCVLVSATSYGAWAFRPAEAVPAVAAAATQAAAATARQEAQVQEDSRRLTPPRYPADAVRAGTSGKVVLRILVGADGGVRDLVVEESVPEGVFDASTIEAARQWQFTPAMEDGRPVEGWVRVPVEYEWGPLDTEEPGPDGS